MKVLQVISYFAPEFGGSNKSVFELSKSLKKAGIDISIFTTNISKYGKLKVPPNEEVFKEGISIYYYEIGFLRKWYFSLHFLIGLIKHIDEFDVVQIHGLYTFPSFISGILCRLKNIPYIITPFGTLTQFIRNKNKIIKSIYWIIFEKSNFDHANFIHYKSAEEMKQSHKPMRIHANPIVIPNGLNLNDYLPLPRKSEFLKEFPVLRGKKIILFLNRIAFQKGLDILIPAFADVVTKRNDICLVIAGSSEDGYDKTVEQLAKTYDIEDRIIFTGNLEGKRKLGAFASADIFVLPSYMENFGTSVVEAMACHLPVIISNQVFIWKEILDAGIVIKCDKNELTKAIIHLIDNPNIGKKMGANGNRLVEMNYSWQRVTKQMIEVYSKIISFKGK